jgi:hypothetical protein
MPNIPGPVFCAEGVNCMKTKQNRSNLLWGMVLAYDLHSLFSPEKPGPLGRVRGVWLCQSIIQHFSMFVGDLYCTPMG